MVAVALPPMLARHLHVSERVDLQYTDCTADAGVMLEHDCHDPSVPVTHASGDALRAAVTLSYPPGMNGIELHDALARVYGWHPDVGPGGAYLPPVGWAAVIAGNSAATSLISPFRHSQPYNPPKAHAVYIACYGPSQYWLDDPLMGSGYDGEPVSAADIIAFERGISGGWHVAAPLIVEIDMTVLKFVAGSVKQLDGTYTFDGKVHRLIPLTYTDRTTDWVPITTAEKLPAVFRGTLTPPLEGGLPGEDRSSCVAVVRNGQVYVALCKDGIYQAQAPITFEAGIKVTVDPLTGVHSLTVNP